MTRTQYYTATSIDGFIADADHALSWLFEVEGDPAERRDEWESFIGAVGAMTSDYEEGAAFFAFRRLMYSPCTSR